jgi:hypothetical protein
MMLLDIETVALVAMAAAGRVQAPSQVPAAPQQPAALLEGAGALFLANNGSRAAAAAGRAGRVRPVKTFTKVLEAMAAQASSRLFPAR